MPKARDPNREKAFQIYKESAGSIDLVDIASQLSISPGTVRGWKSKDKWEQLLNGTLRKNTERSKRNKGGQPGNNNGTGPPENKNAEKHGLFSKYLPKETLDIVNNMSLDPIDILWDQIQIAYAAIIRSQQIMHVTDKFEMIKEVKKTKTYNSSRSTAKTESNESEEEIEYEFQFAWDRQANLLKAQARAQSELRSMIKQYDELCRSHLATEEQKERIRHIKAQTDKLAGTDNQDELKRLDEVLAEIKGVI